MYGRFKPICDAEYLLRILKLSRHKLGILFGILYRLENNEILMLHYLIDAPMVCYIGMVIAYNDSKIICYYSELQINK